eukprot:1149472-Pelagomonas_calceolata.AAC.5
MQLRGEARAHLHPVIAFVTCFLRKYFSWLLTMHAAPTLLLPAYLFCVFASFFYPFAQSLSASSYQSRTMLTFSCSQDVDGTTLIVPPSTNLAQLQSMVDIAEEGTTLDLKVCGRVWVGGWVTGCVSPACILGVVSDGCAVWLCMLVRRWTDGPVNSISEMNSELNHQDVFLSFQLRSGSWQSPPARKSKANRRCQYRRGVTVV